MRTNQCVSRLYRETDLTVAAHLTCVGASRGDVNVVIDTYTAIGIRHIVAIRGDMPDMGAFEAHPQGYSSVVELVAECAKRGFEVSVSSYPEPHPESYSFGHDIDVLQAKADAGATRAITQFCFDNDAYVRLRDRVVAAGLSLEIVPGIMPTTNFAGIERMAAKCGAVIPDELRTRYVSYIDDASACRAIATEFAQEQCAYLVRHGFDALHFYTLNQARLTRDVCVNLKLGGQK